MEKELERVFNDKKIVAINASRVVCCSTMEEAQLDAGSGLLAMLRRYLGLTNQVEHFIKLFDEWQSVMQEGTEEEHFLSSSVPWLIVEFFRRTGMRHLLGNNAEEEAFVHQWLEFVYINFLKRRPVTAPLRHRILKHIDSTLTFRTYLVGTELSVADIVLHHMLYPILDGMSYVDRANYINISRWYAFLQADPAIAQSKRIISFSRCPSVLQSK